MYGEIVALPRPRGPTEDCPAPLPWWCVDDNTKCESNPVTMPTTPSIEDAHIVLGVYQEMSGCGIAGTSADVFE